MANCASCNAVLDSFTKITEETRYAGCDDCLTISCIVHDNGEATGRMIAGIPSVEELAEPGSVTESILKATRAAIVELPAFPDIPMEVIRLAHDPITSMDDLARVIVDDANLSLRILKLANSAYLSPASEITELNQACAMLGMKVINQMAHAACTSAAYERISKNIPDHVRQLWLHSVFSARCAGEVADSCGLDQATSPFLAGLVHDIGKLVILDAAFNRYSGRLGRLEEDAELLNAVLAKFAPLVGAHVVQHWELANRVLAATYFIHRPELLEPSEWRPFVCSVALGSQMATALGYDIGTDAAAGTLPDGVEAIAEQAGLGTEEMETIFQRVSESATEYASAIDLN